MNVAVEILLTNAGLETGVTSIFSVQINGGGAVDGTI
jgi:hypothetical protein